MSANDDIRYYIDTSDGANVLSKMGLDFLEIDVGKVNSFEMCAWITA